MYKFKNKKERIAHELRHRGYAIVGYTKDGYVRILISNSV